MEARARWEQTWSHIPSQPPPGLIDDLISAYSEPHRAYHTIDHLAECFGHLDSCSIEPGQPAALELALWFHDAIYDTKSPNNEDKSAEWAAESLGALEPAVVAMVQALIGVTKHNAEPRSDDERLLLDIDLSILGAPPERFSQYEDQVRHEYSWVPVDVYSTARVKILREFAGRAALYHTDYFRERFEARARENLQRSIEALAT